MSQWREIVGWTYLISVPTFLAVASFRYTSRHTNVITGTFPMIVE